MIKKTIIKYAYFAIVLLSPYLLVFLPFDINPFELFLALPWLFDIDMTNYGVKVIWFIVVMTIYFFISFQLYEINKEKRGYFGRAFLVIVVLLFVTSIIAGCKRTQRTSPLLIAK